MINVGPIKSYYKKVKQFYIFCNYLKLPILGDIDVKIDTILLFYRLSLSKLVILDKINEN